MKKVFFIAILGILSLTLGAQVSFDSAGYKAYKKTIFANDVFQVSNSEVLFWFANYHLRLGVNDQTKNLYFIDEPIDDILSTELKVKRVQCKDDGGFLCILSTGYLSDEKINFISIEYNNIIFFYRVNETSERPWDNDPIELEPHKMRTEPYTPEEIDKLVKSYRALKTQTINIFKEIL